MRDAYEKYGYDFHYYHGEIVDDAWIAEKAAGAKNQDRLIKETYQALLYRHKKKKRDPEEAQKMAEEEAQEIVKKCLENRINIGKTLRKGLRFANADGQPLKMMPLLELDPALLEQPLYH